MQEGLLNYTPHAITVYSRETNEPLVTIHPQNKSIRLGQAPQKELSMVEIDSQMVHTIEPPHFRGMTTIPPQGSSIIVSALVAEYIVKNLFDNCASVFAPDTGPNGCVRSADGQIMGTYQLVRYK